MGEKVKVKFRGATFEVALEGVPELLSQLGIGPYEPRRAPRSLSRESDHEETLVGILRALLQHSGGLPSDDVASLIGVSDPRGIPRVVRVWRKLATGIGFDLADLLQNRRRGQKRFWIAGPKAKSALRALDERRVGRKRST